MNKYEKYNDEHGITYIVHELIQSAYSLQWELESLLNGSSKDTLFISNEVNFIKKVCSQLDDFVSETNDDGGEKVGC